MTPNEWVMSCDNPTRARYVADSLWKQGIRSGDRTIITQMYGYSEHDTDILCAVLADMERIAEVNMKNYNPELGF